MRKVLLAGLAAAVLFAGACSKESPEKAAAEPTVEGNVIRFPADGKAPPLASKVVALEPAPSIRLNGRVVWDEERTVRVFTPFAGRVARILVKPGDSVRQGQALAVLASPEFGQAQAEARRAEADVALAEKNLQRTKELESYGVAPRKDLQVSEAEHARARSELERARARLKLYGSSSTGVDQTYTMASPVSGVVVERNINPGQELRPDLMTSNAPPLFVITNPNYLWVILDASERDLPHLPIGKLVSIRTPVYREEDFTAWIAAVSDFFDPATRTLKVRATLDNRHRRLKAEMFVTGEVEAKRVLQMQVPTKSTFFQNGKHFAFTDDGKGQYTRREVRIGDENHGDVAILEGLEDGQRVVIEGALMLQQMLQPRRVQK